MNSDIHMTRVGTSNPTCRQLRNNLDLRRLHRLAALEALRVALNAAEVAETDRFENAQAERSSEIGSRIGESYDHDEMAGKAILEAIASAQTAIRAALPAVDQQVPGSPRMNGAYNPAKQVPAEPATTDELVGQAEDLLEAFSAVTAALQGAGSPAHTNQ